MRWLLLIHILSLVAYLGPSLGGSYVYLAARRRGDPTLILWTLRQSIFLYNVEHLALLALLASGAAMLAAGGWALLAAGWMKWKLALIAAVILPVEIWDVAVVNYVLRRALQQGVRLDAPPLARAIRLHDRVLAVGGAIFTAGVLAVLALAVIKPAL